MIIFRLAKDIHIFSVKEKESDQSIGFVPTMGALHEGHLSLIRQSKDICDITVCSIYVNPLQFNNKEDFDNYPIVPGSDLVKLEETGCDVVFIPETEEIYPEENFKTREFDLGYLEHILEGKFRPGHFQGVCKVVARLLDIVAPNILFLGQKDYQQTLVIKKLISLLDLPIDVKVIPTMRESDGLAMSSRNMRLSPGERETATALYRTLTQLSNKIINGTIGEINIELENAGKDLEKQGFQLDYLEIADPETLLPIPRNYNSEKVVLLIAAYLNGVRLIDNLVVSS